jgi:hypothetical protein
MYYKQYSAGWWACRITNDEIRRESVKELTRQGRIDKVFTSTKDTVSNIDWGITDKPELWWHSAYNNVTHSPDLPEPKYDIDKPWYQSLKEPFIGKRVIRTAAYVKEYYVSAEAAMQIGTIISSDNSAVYINWDNGKKNAPLRHYHVLEVISENKEAQKTSDIQNGSTGKTILSAVIADVRQGPRYTGSVVHGRTKKLQLQSDILATRQSLGSKKADRTKMLLSKDLDFKKLSDLDDEIEGLEKGMKRLEEYKTELFPEEIK